MSEPKQILCQCKICGQQVLVDYEPNEFISEGFVRNSFICSKHAGVRSRLKVVQKREASVPYKDD